MTLAHGFLRGAMLLFALVILPLALGTLASKSSERGPDSPSSDPSEPGLSQLD